MPGAAFLRGDSVTLRTVEQDDMAFLRDTVNEPEVRGSLTTAKPLHGVQEQGGFEKRISSDESVNLLVCDGDDPLGVVLLKNIDHRVGFCELGICLGPEFQGRGYGTEAARLMTGYAFDELRMHRVEARIFDHNETSQRVLEKLGFEEEGVHRDEAFAGGDHVDIRYFSVLKDEWDGS